MRALVTLCALAMLVVGCSEPDDGPPGGEPFAFSDWVAGIEYVLTIDLAEGPRPAESAGLVVWSGTVTTIEWQRQTTTEGGRSVAVESPSPGDRVEVTMADSVAASSGATVIALVNDLRMADGVEHIAQLALDVDWQPLPGSLEPAVDGLETAAAATAMSSRRGAILAVLEGMTR